MINKCQVYWNAVVWYKDQRQFSCHGRVRMEWNSVSAFRLKLHARLSSTKSIKNDGHQI